MHVDFPRKHTVCRTMAMHRSASTRCLSAMSPVLARGFPNTHSHSVSELRRRRQAAGSVAALIWGRQIHIQPESEAVLLSVEDDCPHRAISRRQYCGGYDDFECDTEVHVAKRRQEESASNAQVCLGTSSLRCKAECWEVSWYLYVCQVYYMSDTCTDSACTDFAPGDRRGSQSSALIDHQSSSGTVDGIGRHGEKRHRSVYPLFTGSDVVDRLVPFGMPVLCLRSHRTWRQTFDILCQPSMQTKSKSSNKLCRKHRLCYHTNVEFSVPL
ncbi:hypothetical protein C8Q80DRAFT_208633 [Daedaleopsis nitida]|nr:hypothetical protein C8Q80DRAFT_208633 [Daedaleopsis nitida]